MNDYKTWLVPGTKTKVLNKLELAIKKISSSLPWFKGKGEVEIIADNFGVTVKFKLGGHFRIVHISIDEILGGFELQFHYEDRLRMQLQHLHYITTNSSAYSASDQITSRFDL